MLLDAGFNLTLRPMKYPEFYEMYRNAIKNTWTVEEVDFSTDFNDLRFKMNDAERHLINRLVAFFATGDSIVANNLVLNLYKHINAPEARMYLSRQLYEEALHVQFYLTLLDTYIPDLKEREAAFAAVENIPSIHKKAEFCFKWIDSINDLDELKTQEDRRKFLLNLICFAACIEGLFFFAAFAYVYFLRSKGLLHGLAAGTNWVFRDESCLPEGSEILTEKGFVDIKILETEKLKVAQYYDDGCISFVKPRTFIKKPYNDDLITLSTDKSFYQSVTLDHDVVVKSVSTGKHKKVKGEKILANWNTIIPVAGYADGKEHFLSDEQRFAIAFQADGSLSSRYDGSRCGTLPVKFTLVKDVKKERLRNLLARLEWNFQEREKTDNRIEFKVDVPKDALFDKEFSWIDLTTISGEWAQEFIEELSFWDSYKAEDRTCIQYTNTNLQAVDKVQCVAVLGGFSCSKYEREDNRKETYRKVYNLYIKKRDYVTLKKLKKERTPYQGNVYCVNVPTGMIVIRQQGKVCITGNCHMNFAFEVVKTVLKEETALFDENLKFQISAMLDEAVDCEMQFAEDILSGGIAGLSISDMRQYLEFIADQRLTMLGLPKNYHAKNPFSFMDLQDVQELANFFERRVSAYQVAVAGEVSFNEAF
jgi:ribonucleotide reductase beta subunit family protein with ferritin-like domain